MRRHPAGSSPIIARRWVPEKSLRTNLLLDVDRGADRKDLQHLVEGVHDPGRDERWLGPGGLRDVVVERRPEPRRDLAVAGAVVRAPVMPKVLQERAVPPDPAAEA